MAWYDPLTWFNSADPAQLADKMNREFYNQTTTSPGNYHAWIKKLQEQERKQNQERANKAAKGLPPAGTGLVGSGDTVYRRKFRNGTADVELEAAGSTNPYTAEQIRQRRYRREGLGFMQEPTNLSPTLAKSRDYGRTQQQEDRLAAMERNQEYYKRRTGQIHTAPNPETPMKPPTHTRTLKGLGIAMSYENPDGSRRYFSRGEDGKLQEVALPEEQQRMYADAERNQENQQQQQQQQQQQRNQQLEQYAEANQARGWGELRSADDRVVLVGKDEEGRSIYQPYQESEPHDMGPHSDANGRPVMTRAEAGLGYDYRNEEERRWQLEQREKAARRPRPGKPLHLRKNKYRQPWR